jgi:hypothetical protein
MIIETPGESDSIAVRSRRTYRLILEAELQSIPEIVRLRSLIKLALRSFGFHCIRLEEITLNADALAESPPSKQQKP